MTSVDSLYSAILLLLPGIDLVVMWYQCFVDRMNKCIMVVGEIEWSACMNEMDVYFVGMGG